VKVVGDSDVVSQRINVAANDVDEAFLDAIHTER
jgi:hypothetical protein